jgi:hypothetical protein
MCLHFQGGNHLYPDDGGSRFIQSISNHFETTRYHNLKDHNLNFHRRENSDFI